VTSPGNGSNFETGEDFVAARFSIDVPTEGIATMRELSQEIERYRVGAESASRAQDDFVRYLSESAEAAERAASAQQNLLGQMERVLELQQRMGTAGGSTSVPQGYVDPFSGAQSGVGREEVQAQIDRLRESDPRTYLNMQASRGNLRAGDIPAGSPDENQLHQSAARVHEREQQNAQRQHENPAAGPVGREGGGGWGAMGMAGAGIAGQVMNEMSPGGSLPGIAGLAANALNRAGSAAAAGGLQGGALSGLMRGLGVAGLGVGGLLAANGLVQQGGEFYQNYANMGSVRGGGFAEGMGQELAIRSMAMNPFLTTEQSRQIIQGALTEGYSGKTFDSVTGYIAHNLTEMNMQVSQSLNMVRKNVMEGGQSIEGNAANLGVLKELSKTGASSLPELIERFQQTSGALISTGMSGPNAERASMYASSMFGDSQALKGYGDQLTQAFNNPQGMAMMQTFGGIDVPRGLMPGAMQMAMGPEAMVGGAENVLKRFAKQFYDQQGRPQEGTPQYFNAAYMFFLTAQRMGLQIDQTRALELFRRYAKGESGFPAAKEGVDKEVQANTQVESRGFWQQVGGAFADAATNVGDFLGNRVKGARGMIGSAFSGEFGEIPGQLNNMLKNEVGIITRPSVRGSENRIPMLDQIMGVHGPQGIEVLDSNGRPMKLDTGNREMMDKLSGGEYTWRQRGTNGPGQKLQDTTQGSMQRQGVEVNGQVVLGLTPEAQRLLAPQGGNVIRLTPHEQQANAGYGTAAPNNAPPGMGARR
jgi:hypothetical protein